MAQFESRQLNWRLRVLDSLIAKGPAETFVFGAAQCVGDRKGRLGVVELALRAALAQLSVALVPRHDISRHGANFVFDQVSHKTSAGRSL